MEAMNGVEDKVLSLEVFAAKDSAGKLKGLMLTVPCHCGLHEADSLRIRGLSVVALQAGSIMPLDLPDLSDPARNDLVALARSGQALAVGEFTATGLRTTYFLNLTVVE